MEDKKCLVGGGEITEEHKELKENGQQEDYVVICPEDRAKGFVRPYRETYIHVGMQPKYPDRLRDLTDEEKERYPEDNYVKFEEYPESDVPMLGKYWTQERLDNNGCGGTTTMSREIAETYARNPYFYGSTFCVHCGKHLPLKEFVWEGTTETVGS